MLTPNIEITGNLHFDLTHISKKHKSQSNWKDVGLVLFNDDSADLYSWLIKKRFNISLNKPIRGFHLTLINDKLSDSNLLIEEFNEKKKIFNGKPIRVQYSTDVRTNGEHWWLKAWSKEAEDIRRLFGLKPEPYWNFHLTIGYVAQGNPDKKGLIYNQMWEHSHYIHNLIKTNRVII
jgi:hypothetical protein